MSKQNALHIGFMHNLCGKFEASFTSPGAPGEARYPYHSQTLHNRLARTPEYLNFDSTSGTSPLATATSDRRSIGITLRSEIVSGTYVFPRDASVVQVTYGEFQNSDTNFNFMTHPATHAELELNITEEGRRYSGELRFEVLINGEVLEIASRFDVVITFNGGPAVSSSIQSKQSPASARLQNLSGEFNARFPVSAEPGETSFARAPYHSSGLNYIDAFFQEDINFNTQSGRVYLDSYITSDARSFSVHLKKGITSGTYSYPSVGSPFTLVKYNEMRYMGDGYLDWSLDILEATLELEVTDERRYVAKALSIKAKTPTGSVLNINADFDIYLAMD
ncbi:archaellum component FlaF (FlaF/FlaG flagellin family) [Pseudomonas sp. EB276 TE3739]|uniref:hypothetical protein n=1 Tax=Pseudomonas TaxID=286 RepID=UPI00209D6C9E|nr:hypothetical protein [Pseudomonas koreensis]MCP1472510.1 archaellum component FlaF (FlaF/FlaG flagellin family) [Pseudomonas koreensis]